jgi:hypothetical protein
MNIVVNKLIKNRILIFLYFDFIGLVGIHTRTQPSLEQNK